MLQCHDSYAFVYLLAIVVVAAVVALRNLRSWSERLALLCVLFPGVGLLVYFAAVALSFEVFQARVLRLIVFLESIVLAFAVATAVLIQKCSMDAIFIACIRAALTHVLLWQWT